MDMQKALLVICITLGLVLVLNIGIILRFGKNQGARTDHYKSLSRLFSVSKDFRKQEEDQLIELSDLVSKIKDETGDTDNT
jgi:hypothetical protein